MIDCESGTSAAPKQPWASRNSTISPSDCAAPQSIEVTVKPASETTKRFRRPKRAASHPTGAVMIAAAMM